MGLVTGSNYGGDMSKGRPDFTLESQLCFALHAASRAMAGCYRPLLAEIGLTYSQYLVMLVLWESEVATVGDLGRRLYLDSATLSPLVKRLEAQGLVDRDRRTADERVVEVRLTSAGRRLEAHAAQVQSSVQRATGLAQADLVTLRQNLNVLAATLRDVGTAGGVPAADDPPVEDAQTA